MAEGYLGQLILWSGWIIGRLISLTGYRSSVIESNLKLAFPGELPNVLKARKQLKSRAYSHLGRLFVEIVFFLSPFGKLLIHKARFIGKEHFEEAKKRGVGILCVSSHVGNWEVMAAVGARNGMFPLIVTKHLKPEWLHQLFNNRRSAMGVSGTYEPKTIRDIMRRLKENGSIGMVLDQYAGPPVGCRVPLFGVPVGTSMAVATLAKRTGVPVLPITSFRDKDGNYTVTLGPPIPWIQSDLGLQHELCLNTAAYVQRIEREILSHPDQWLWTHRRFKGNLGPLAENEWTSGRVRN